MCGIVGIHHFNQHQIISEKLLRTMLGAIRHRGPDQFGLYLGKYIGLGSARLSIIDLLTGQQPMCNEDGSIWIVFNGEIYNYLELREDLEVLGHQFTTKSDTEVILHLYEENGSDALSLMNGQFAFAIWDKNKNELFLARDRFGIRPLFYITHNNTLTFASEIKAILANRHISTEIDQITLDQVFTYWSAISPRTIFKKINELPPGHYMRVYQDKIEINSYWQLEFPDRKHDLLEKPFPLGEPLRLGEVNEIIEKLYSLLVDSTRIRLRADIPVGAYLSGGLDSSIIAHIICKETSTPIETFSITFDDLQYDESKYQMEMASHLDVKHHTIHVTPQKIGQIFPKVIWHTEIPILRTSPAPMYLLSKLVNENNYKVVLTGEGADEFFCGYNIYKETKIRNFWAMNPDSNKRPLLLKRLYPFISDFSDRNFNFLLAFYKQGLTRTGDAYYSHSSRWRTTRQSKRLFSRQFKEGLDNEYNLEIGAATQDGHVDIPTNFHKWDFIQKAQFLECTIFMSQYLLSSQGDRMAMANSVEGRFPFLDHHLIEFSNQLPTQLKLFALNEKFILKKMATKYIPRSISYRSKQPYRAPISESFLGDHSLDYIDEVLSNEYLEETGLFEPKAVQILMRKARKMERLSEANEMAIAGIISSQLIHSLFIKDFPTFTQITKNDDIKVVYDHEL